MSLIGCAIGGVIGWNIGTFITNYMTGNSVPNIYDLIKKYHGTYETSSDVIDCKISSRFTIKITFPSDTHMMNFISVYNRHVNRDGKMELECKSGFKFHIKIFKDGKYNNIDVD